MIDEEITMHKTQIPWLITDTSLSKFPLLIRA